MRGWGRWFSGAGALGRGAGDAGQEGALQKKGKIVTGNGRQVGHWRWFVQGPLSGCPHGGLLAPGGPPPLASLFLVILPFAG